MLKTSKRVCASPGSSPTTASAQSVQVEGSRWECSNECKDAGHDPHYRHFASGRAKNRRSCSQRVRQHQTTLWHSPVSFAQLCFFSWRCKQTDAHNTHTHTHCFKRGALLLFFLINNTSLFHILLCTLLQIVSRQTHGAFSYIRSPSSLHIQTPRLLKKKSIA